MADRICIDSDVLISFLRGDPGSVNWFENHEGELLATTIINAFELYSGAFSSSRSEENVRSTEFLIKKLIILPGSIESSKKAGEWFALLKKAGRRVDMRDILIGGIAFVGGFYLKTNNKEHFSRLPGLVLQD